MKCDNSDNVEIYSDRAVKMLLHIIIISCLVITQFINDHHEQYLSNRPTDLDDFRTLYYQFINDNGYRNMMQFAKNLDDKILNPTGDDKYLTKQQFVDQISSHDYCMIEPIYIQSKFIEFVIESEAYYSQSQMLD